MSDPSFTALETQARNHGVVISIGFLILLPIGVLIPRLFRTYTNRWWLGHWVIQSILSAPMILVGWYLGHEASGKVPKGQSTSIHGGLGGFIVIVYIGQLALGAFIHFVKTPSLFGGRRPPQNYFHGFVGLLILALAAYQVHEGLVTEWPKATGNVHPVSHGLMIAWTVFIVMFWVLYAAGLSLIPRQYKQEAQKRSPTSAADEFDLQYTSEPLGVNAPWAQGPRYDPL